MKRLTLFLMSAGLAFGQTDLNDEPQLTTLATGDYMWIIDASDTTDDPAGSSKYITITTLRDWFFANGSVAAATDLSLTATSGQDILLTLGDAVGTNKLSIRDSSSVEVASINSDGDLSVTDTTTNTLFWNEKAANGTPGAGKGEVWIKNTTPSTLFYTDDANTDFQVATMTGTETLTNKTITGATIDKTSTHAIFTEKHAASHTLTDTECYGAVYYVTAAATLTLPAAVDGMNLTVVTVGAVAVSVDTNASDLIMLDGTALDDGDKITNTSTSGDIAVLTYYDETGWYASTNSWTDGGP